MLKTIGDYIAAIRNKNVGHNDSAVTINNPGSKNERGLLWKSRISKEQQIELKKGRNLAKCIYSEKAVAGIETRWRQYVINCFTAYDDKTIFECR